MRACGRAAVFNLSVEGCPEYFAQGVLVHNCVWAGTFLMENAPPPGAQVETTIVGMDPGEQRRLERRQAREDLAPPPEEAEDADDDDEFENPWEPY